MEICLPLYEIPSSFAVTVMVPAAPKSMVAEAMEPLVPIRSASAPLVHDALNSVLTLSLLLISVTMLARVVAPASMEIVSVFVPSTQMVMASPAWREGSLVTVKVYPLASIPLASALIVITLPPPRVNTAEALTGVTPLVILLQP